MMTAAGAGHPKKLNKKNIKISKCSRLKALPNSSSPHFVFRSDLTLDSKKQHSSRKECEHACAKIRLNSRTPTCFLLTCFALNVNFSLQCPQLVLQP